jgi:RsiW-degrading membrane proteinase PrsW (M82 family)
MSDRQAFYKRRKWPWVLIVGILLFVAADQALRFTGNPNFFPTVLLLGSFTVPVTFVTYIYERERRLDTHTESPLLAATLCFLVGGAVGVVAAGVVEFETLKSLSAPGLLGVGAIEEAAKLIFPVGLFLWGRYRSEMDGILFGVAAGMGFASLETMGYGLVSFIKAGGDINVLDQVLLVRGLLSPVGHAAWTGLVCAVLWRERRYPPYAVGPVKQSGWFDNSQYGICPAWKPGCCRSKLDPPYPAPARIQAILGGGCF